MDNERLSWGWDPWFLLSARSLIPRQEYVKNGNMAVERVIEFLKTQQHKYAIDRVCTSGSHGKSTSLVESDFDHVLLINEIDPALYVEVVGFFKDLLEQHQIALKISDLSFTRYSLQFQLEGTFNVDLLPTPNYVPNKERQGLSGAEIKDLQKENVMEKISADPGKYYRYSSALGEYQVEFMKKQDSMTHSLVRLCKYWLKCLKITYRYGSGVKSAIELIAARSMQTKGQRKKQSILTAFTFFLYQIEHLESLNIVFHPTTGKIYRRINRKISRPSSLLRRTIPEEILRKPYFIIDPANPYNDLSEDITRIPDLHTQIKRYAKLTRVNLQHRPSTPPINPDFKTFFEECAIASQTTNSGMGKNQRKNKRIQIKSEILNFTQ